MSSTEGGERTREMWARLRVEGGIMGISYKGMQGRRDDGKKE